MEENKNKNKGLIVLVVLLIIFVLGLCGYIIYDKILLSNKIVENKQSITTTKKNETVNVENYKYLIDSENNKQYLVKESENNYRVIYDLGDSTHFIGFYNNKFYYSDTKIKYIDLTSNDLKEEIWVELPKPDCSDSTEICVQDFISRSKIINNVLYFSFSSFGGSKTDGLLSLDLNAVKFDEYKVISSDVDLDKWFVDETNENIYYMSFYFRDNAVYKYNIKTSNIEKLFATSSSFDNIVYAYKNIVYYNHEKKELSLYNPVNNSSIILLDTLPKNGWGNFIELGLLCSSIGKNIYYYDGKDKIIKYDLSSDKKTDYYIINDNYYSSAFYDDNNFMIKYDCMKNGGNYTCSNSSYYISNGEIVEQLPTIKVTMLDGTVKEFPINSIK